jgi:hypothetical protein
MFLPLFRKFLQRQNRKARHSGRTSERRRKTLFEPRMESLEGRSMLTMMTPVSYAGGNPTQVQIADMNHDGRPDIVELNSSLSAVSVMLANSDGTFQPSINSPTGGFGGQMNIADYNGDGKLDIAVNNSSAIDILMSNGDGSFQLPVGYYIGAVANDIETGDFNNDGFEDLVTASFGYGGTSQLLLNTGTGTFGAPRNLAIGSLGREVEPGDFNDDGNLDLLETSGGSSAGELIGNGDGTFRSMTFVNLGVAAVDVRVADFNHDGTPDLAVSNGSSLTMLTGQANGNFQAGSTYAITPSTDIQVADLNEDGALDVITSQGQTSFGRGDGSFYSPSNYTATTGSAIAVGDINGDGGAGIVAANPAGIGTGVNVALNANNDATLLGGAVGLVVTAPVTVTAGSPISVTITAVDANGNVVPGFLGTVGVSGAGPQVTSYTFAPADGGIHTITAAASLIAAGPQQVTVTSPFLPNGSATVTVTAAAAAKFSISADATAVAGQPASVTVRAYDMYGNFAANYTGTVHFSSSDVQAGLPADYTFTAGDGGSHTFAVNLKTSGQQTVTATDTLAGTITGQSTSVSVTAAAATSLAMSGGGGYIGSANAVTIVARDAYGNVATGYSGVVHLVSSEPASSTSADAPLINGTGIFTVTPMTLGNQTLTATDTATGSLIASESINVTPGWGVRFVATPLANTAAGQTQSMTITAYDAFGNISTVYTGTIRVATTDPQASLAYYAFSAANAGVLTIPVTFRTAGTQSVTVSDYVDPSVTVTQTGIQVTPGAAVSIATTALHGGTAGVAQSFTVTARDVYGNIATGYRGTVNFTSSDSQAALPAAYTFTAADAGTHTFSMTFKTAGGQSFTAVDTANAAMTTFQGDIPISAAAVSGFSLRAPSNVVAGTPFTLIVTAVDAFGNQVSGYTGKVHFSGPSGTGNLLPADYLFTAADAGSHSFSITLSSTGTQTITVQDTVTTSIKAQTSVKVNTSGTVSGGGGGGGGTSTGGGGTATGGGTSTGGGGGGGGKKIVA